MGTVVPCAAKLPAEVEPVDARKEDVEDDEVVVVDRDLLERVIAVGGDIHGVRVLAQTLREHGRGHRLVLNDQDSHLVSFSGWQSQAPLRSFP